MRREHRAGLRDRLHETVGEPPRAGLIDQSGDHLVPYLLLDLRGDACVRDHLGIAFGERDEDEHAGPRLRGVETMRQELLDGARMCPRSLQRVRHDRDVKRRQ